MQQFSCANSVPAVRNASAQSVTSRARWGGVAKRVRNVAVLCGVWASLGTLALAQSCPSREYVYLGSRALATEVAGGLSLPTTSATLTAVAGASSFTVLNPSPSVLNWTATVSSSSQSWLSLQLNGQSVSTFTGNASACTSSGAGTSTITYQVLSNSAASGRTGTITVTTSSSSLTFTVTQSGSGSAGFSISPTSGNFTYTGGTSSFTLSATVSTSWTAKSNASWVTLTSNSLSGSGTPATISYQVNPNTLTSSRTATITVGGLAYAVNQAGAPALNTLSLDSVSPSGATGTSTVFTAVYSDTGGASSLDEVQLLVGTSNTVLGGECYVRWLKATGAFSLKDDDATTWIPVGSDGTVSNSQCTFSATGSSVTTNGNRLTATFNISAFKLSFSNVNYAKNVYLQAIDNSGPIQTGLVAKTTYLVAQTGSPTLTGSMTPAASTATEQAFYVTAQTGRPYDQIIILTVLMNNLNTSGNPNAALTEDEGSCGFWFLPSMDPPLFMAFGDGGGVGGAGSGTFGQAAALANSQCTLNLSKSVAVSTTLQNVEFLVDITASPNFKGQQQTSIQGLLNASAFAWMPLQPIGTWTPYPLVTKDPPSASSQTVSPSSGTGLSPILTFTATSANSYAYISELDVWINSTPSGVGGCRLLVDAFTKGATFLNDDGSSVQGTLGQSAPLSNGMCSIDMASATLVSSGNNRVLTLPVTFTQAFAGTRNQYFRVTEKSGNTTGWVQAGTWIVQAVSGTPSAGAVAPTSGQGLSQIFTVTASDTAGAADLASLQLLINNSATPANACAVSYVRAQNVFQLLDDTGTGIAGSVTPGQATTASNSQCSISGTGSSVQIVGPVMTMVVSVYFNPTFASTGGGATKNTYIIPVTTAGFTPAGGPAPAGTWTVPAQSPTPTISSLSPGGAPIGGPAFTLTLNGTNYVSGVVVQWNGAPLNTTFVSSTRITATVPASLIATAGTASVTAVNPTAVASGAATFFIQLAPRITSLSPSLAAFCGDALTLTVTGANFLAGAVVTWNGVGITTTYLSSTLLQATVTNSVAKATGVIPITVRNPSGLSSDVLTFSSLPFIGGATTLSVTQGAPTFDFWVVGCSGVFTFVPSSVVQWNGTALATFVQDSILMRATVPASLLVSPGTANLTVYTPGVGTSPPVPFQIQSSGSGPVISALNPYSAIAGGAAFSLTITGGGFVSGSTVKWNGTTIASTYNSASQLTASIAANLISAAGTATVTVTNPGGASTKAGFTIRANAPDRPAVVSVTPSSGQGSAQAFALVVSDSAGAADLATVQLLIGSSTNLNSACAVTYSAATRQLSLMNDEGTAAVGSVVPGQGVSISNSQCTLFGTGSSVQTSGNLLTMTANLGFFWEFASSGGATKTVYGRPTTSAGAVPASGTTAVGTWTITQAPSTLSIAVAHAGNFTQGQNGAAYTILVNNASSAGPTSGTVTVTETLPTGLTLVSMAGTGWNCSANTCSRSDQLAAGMSFPGITAMVDVSSSAPASVTNEVSVSDGTSSPVTATDATTILPAPVIASLNPTEATAGGTGFTLTINGTNFVSGAIATWNGTALSTTFVNATQLTVSVPAAQIAAAGTATVLVSANTVNSNAVTFTINAAVPPTITAVTATPGTSTATITWSTDKGSTSRVDYGTSATALSSNVSDAALVTSHSVVVSGLTGGTAYFFRVTSVDSSGNSATSPVTSSSPASFTTVDTTPPVISTVTATPGSNTATVIWSTDEASTSRVDYGTSATALSLNASNATLVTSHSITLSGLTAGTTYFFRVTSVDGSSNSATSPVTSGSPASFTTVDTTPPVILPIGVIPRSNMATVAWSTDEASTSRVDYGTSETALSLNASDATLATSHSITLSGLTAGTTYFFRITSVDGSGNSATFPDTSSSPASFTTVDTTPPSIWYMTATPGAGGTATITWTTSELATSRVDYGMVSSALNLNQTDAALVTAHSINLSGLAAGATYYYRVTSADASGNSATYYPLPHLPPHFTALGFSIFTNQVPTTYDHDLAYDLGTKFWTDVNGQITQVRLYVNATEGGDHSVRIWRVSDSTLLAGPFTWNITSGSEGWKSFTLPTPLAIIANTDYIVSISNSSDQYYAAQQNGFDAPIVNGSLHTYVGSGVYTATLGTMPTESWENSNYFRDIVFVQQ